MADTAHPAEPAKAISAATIFARLRQVLDPAATRVIKPGDSLGDDQGFIDALADQINKFGPFKADNLRLEVADVTGVTTVAELLAAIIKRYRANGFEVT
jgi:hypothetical protein